MKYRVELSKRAKKDLDNIDKRFKLRIKFALECLSESPFLGKALEGEYKGSYSYRVWPYRIIYKVNKTEVIITVVKVGHRQGFY